MKKGRHYRYNTTTCKYEAVLFSPWQRFVRFLRFASAVFACAIGFVWAYFSYMGSPKELALKQENELLKDQYKRLHDKVTQAYHLLEQLQERDYNLYRTLFEAAPLPAAMRKAGTGGVPRYQNDNQQHAFINRAQERVDTLSAQLHVQHESYNQIHALARRHTDRLACVPAIRPVKNGQLRSGFGRRRHPVFGTMRDHRGLDFSAKVGTPVYATGRGIVTAARRGVRGYGALVDINHGYQYRTRYAHLSRILVKKGQRVNRGDLIGLSGKSGIVSGPHVHYEVHKRSKQVDPMPYLVQDVSASEYEELLRVASQHNRSMD